MSEFIALGEMLSKIPSPPLQSPSTRSRSLVKISQGESESTGLRKIEGPGGKETKGRVQTMYLVARCFQCGGPNWLAIDRNHVRPYSKCQCCGEIVPTESMIMILTDYDRTGVSLVEKRMRTLNIG